MGEDYFGYWKYYDPAFSWPDGSLAPDKAFTVERMTSAGLSASEALSAFESGYVVLPFSPFTVIDRYYGGPLRTVDRQSRPSLERFGDWLGGDPAIVYARQPKWSVARSLGEVRDAINEVDRIAGRQLLFRGQTEHFPLQRSSPNPCLADSSGREISLLPSVHRAMIAADPRSCHWFTGMSLLEWSRIIYSQLDMKEVAAHQQEALDRGDWIGNGHDMEDSDDPVLQRFGKLQLDLMYHHDNMGADTLNTILQHYGLRTHYADLTTDLDVALYFATHQFRHVDGRYSYDRLSGRGGSVLYVFRRDSVEMTDYSAHAVIGDLQARRPQQQACVVCRSSAYAINLPAYYVVAVIELQFDRSTMATRTTEDLFPSRHEDPMLAAILDNVLHPEFVTDFIR